jgi:hypothetical protein
MGTALHGTQGPLEVTLTGPSCITIQKHKVRFANLPSRQNDRLPSTQHFRERAHFPPVFILLSHPPQVFQMHTTSLLLFLSSGLLLAPSFAAPSPAEVAELVCPKVNTLYTVINQPTHSAARISSLCHQPTTSISLQAFTVRRVSAQCLVEY